MATKVTGERGGVGRLFRRLYDAGPRLSREEFIAAAAWQPMLVMDFVRWMLKTAEEVHETRDILLRQLRRTDKLDAKASKVARSFCNSLWFIGHMAALGALDGKLPFEDLPPKALEAIEDLKYSWYSVRQGLVGPALRGIWGASRIGQLLVPKYKAFHGQANTLYSVVDSTYSLAAIGLRHSQVADEVEQTLAMPLTRTFAGPEYQAMLDAIANDVAATYRAARADRDPLTVTHLVIGARIAMEYGKLSKPGSRFKFTREEDVPADIAYALPFSTAHEFVGEWKNFQFFSIVLPWLATAKAEQLYLPAEYLSDLVMPYDEEHEIMPLLRALRTTYAKPSGATRTTPKGAARNEPCPCGSGLKYKRCCFGKSEIVPVEKDLEVEEEEEVVNAGTARSDAFADAWESKKQ
jgi:hypothetical protein